MRELFRGGERIAPEKSLCELCSPCVLLAPAQSVRERAETELMFCLCCRLFFSPYAGLGYCTENGCFVCVALQVLFDGGVTMACVWLLLCAVFDRGISKFFVAERCCSNNVFVQETFPRSRKTYVCHVFLFPIGSGMRLFYHHHHHHHHQHHQVHNNQKTEVIEIFKRQATPDR